MFFGEPIHFFPCRLEWYIYVFFCFSGFEREDFSLLISISFYPLVNLGEGIRMPFGGGKNNDNIRILDFFKM